MTALNCIVRPNAVHLFTDMGYYDDQTGVLGALEDKVHQIEGLSGAFVHAGVVDTGKRLEGFIDAEARKGRGLRHVARRLPELVIGLNLPPEETMTAVVAGWDLLAGRPYAIVVVRRPGQPLIASEIKSSLITPGAANTVIGRRPIQVEGLELLELQRRVKHQPASGDMEPKHIVAGAAQHTRIDASGVRKAILRHWNDPIGAVIDPSRMVALDGNTVLLDASIVKNLFAGQTIIAADAQYNPTAGSSFTTSLITGVGATITTQGGKVVVTASMACEASGDAQMIMYIYKGAGSVLGEVVSTALSGKFNNGTLVWVDTSPGSTSVTYTCYALAGTGNLKHEYSSIVVENHKNAS